jgi:hypothetical protein
MPVFDSMDLDAQMRDPAHLVTWHPAIRGEWITEYGGLDMQIIPCGDRGRAWLMVIEVDTGRVSGRLLASVEDAKLRAEGIAARYNAL